MVAFLKKVENRRVSYYVSVPITRFTDKKGYLDVSSLLKEANQHDKRLDYGYEEGPNFSIEVVRAQEYADYVAQYVTADNYNKFSTRNYTVFLSADDPTKV